MECKCNNCGEEFNEPELKGVNEVDYVCPFCKSEDWNSLDYEET